MGKYLIIPEVGERIKQRLNKLNLVPEIDPVEFVRKKKELKHRYYSNCRDSKNRKVSFYARIHDNKDAKNKMIREIIFGKETKSRQLGINQYAPCFIKGGIESDFEWFVREHVEGEALGKVRSLKRKLNLEDASFFVNVLTEIGKIPVKDNIKPYLSKHGSYQQYLSSLRKYQILSEKKIISKRQYQKLSRFVYQSKKLINSQRKVIVHSDLHPGNVIVNGKWWVIDWELIRLDNFTFDISFFWIYFWEADYKFRRKVVEEFFKASSYPDNFEKLFRLTIFYILSEEISYLAKNERMKRYKKRSLFLKELFKNNLESFEKTLEM